MKNFVFASALLISSCVTALFFTSCSSTSMKKDRQSRNPSSSRQEAMTVDIPLTADQRNTVRQQTSKGGRLQFLPSNTPVFQNGLTYAYCKNGLGIDFTKVKVDPFEPGPVTFLDGSGNIIGTGTLTEAINSKDSSFWWNTKLVLNDVSGKGLPATFTLNRQSGSYGLDSAYGGKFQDCQFFCKSVVRRYCERTSGKNHQI